MKKILIACGGIVMLSSSAVHAEDCISGNDLMYALRNSRMLIQQRLGNFPKDAAPLSFALKEGDVVMAQGQEHGMQKCTYSIGGNAIFYYHMPIR